MFPSIFRSHIQSHQHHIFPIQVTKTDICEKRIPESLFICSNTIQETGNLSCCRVFCHQKQLGRLGNSLLHSFFGAGLMGWKTDMFNFHCLICLFRKNVAKSQAIEPFLVSGQADYGYVMPHGRNHFFLQILYGKLNAGGIDTRVATQFFALQHFFINTQFHTMIHIIHKSQYADRTGGNVQKFFHIFFSREGQSGYSQLSREIFCLKLLVSGHHQQIELCFLAIAQE